MRFKFKKFFICLVLVGLFFGAACSPKEEPSPSKDLATPPIAMPAPTLDNGQLDNSIFE